MKNNPRISVIMAACNAEKYISEAIESILNQDFKDFELIIINDGSTDNTLRIIKSCIEKDKRIILIDNKENIYATKSMNRGIKIARGKYIAIQDADDISLKSRLEKEYNFLEKNKDIFLVSSGAIYIDENGKEIMTFTRQVKTTEIKRILEKYNCIFHPSIMFRNIGLLYREKYYSAEDYDFHLGLISRGYSISILPCPLIKYRVHRNSVSYSKEAKMALFAEKAREFYFQRLRYGKDRYDEFDPRTILDIDIETSTNKTVLEVEIKSSFKLNNFKRARLFCKKYFKNYGFSNKIIVQCYLLSFTGKKFVNFLRIIGLKFFNLVI